jgi:hypothetical protein
LLFRFHLFQSSPRPTAGCNMGAVNASILSFLVSILTPPNGGVQRVLRPVELEVAKFQSSPRPTAGCNSGRRLSYSDKRPDRYLRGGATARRSGRRRVATAETASPYPLGFGDHARTPTGSAPARGPRRLAGVIPDEADATHLPNAFREPGAPRSPHSGRFHARGGNGYGHPSGCRVSGYLLSVR